MSHFATTYVIISSIYVTVLCIAGAYTDGLGTSMGGYKKLSGEISRQALIANEYKEELRDEIFVDNTSTGNKCYRSGTGNCLQISCYTVRRK